MNHIADALNDVIVTEEVTSETPFWAVLAIGLAGRLASDFGARVVRLCEGKDPLQPQPGERGSSDHVGHLAALRSFLGEGKEAGDASAPDRITESGPGRIHVRLRYGNDDATPKVTSGIVKEVVFFAGGSDTQADRVPESELTIAARSGLLDIVGRSDARPLMIGGHQISYSTGLSGFLALTALLHSADIDRADVSALGTALWINWKSLAAAAQGRAIPRRSAESGKWRTARCADGYVALVYFDRDWPVLSKMTGDPTMLSLSAERAWTVPENLAELERRLEAWTLLHGREEIAAASKSFGLAIGPVWTPSELLADPQYKARQFFETRSQNPAAKPRPQLPVLVAAHGVSAASRPARANDTAQGPLAGIRVIDLGILTAGASTSAILADLGADVIKVESPTYLDPFRGTPGTSRAEGWWNNSDAFKSTNRNKRGICLDLKSAKGREVFLELAAKSDVVIENFRRGVMQRLGIGYDVLRASNGGILLASVSSQGEKGPDSDNISFGSTLEATSGLAALTAYEDGVPLVTGMDLNYPDQVGSVFAAAAIIAALRSKQRSGAGAHLDISQRELTTYFLGEEFLTGDSGLSRWGNASPEFLLQDTFATKDSWLAVSIVDERQLASALTLIGQVMRNDLDVHDGKQKLVEWMETREAKDICERLREMGIAASLVADGRAVWDYAMQTHGGAIAPLARSPSGDIVKGFPLHLPQRPISVKVAAPNLGQHTEEVLQEVVGMNADALAGLTRDGIIGTRPASPNASRLD